MGRTLRTGLCQICGGDGEIKHVGGYFGAEACCDQCRLFFRKFIDKDPDEYKSWAGCEGKCPMSCQDGENSKFRRCPTCRLAKCVEIGMSLTKGRMHLAVTHLKEEGTYNTPRPKPVSGSSKKSKLSLKGSKTKKSMMSPKASSQPAESSSSKEVVAEVEEPLPKVPCVASLHNLGNTCFLNSVVQVLRYTPKFEESLHDLAKQVKLTTRERCLIAQLDTPVESEKEKETKDDIDYSSWDVVKHLDIVFHKMNRTEENFLNGSQFIGTRPYDLIDTIAQLNPMFEGNQQQDTHELMRCLLAYIQDASRSLNKYRKKSAEGLGQQPSDEYITEPKSLHSSPVKVEMRGGLKDPKTPPKSNSPAEPKSATRTSKRLSGGNQKRETFMKALADLKSPGKRGRGRKSLTELQNHELPGQRSILDCYSVKNGGTEETSVEANGSQEGTMELEQEIEDCNETEENKRLSNKRKASGDEGIQAISVQADEDTEQNFVKLSASERRLAHKKRRFLSAQQPGATPEDSKNECGADGENPTENNTSQGGRNTTKAPSSPAAGGSLERGQGDSQFVTAQVCTKPFTERKQTARKSFGSPKVDHINVMAGKTKERPVTKEAVVKLDKNGIAKYFQQVSAPMTLADIERHLDPVNDCIEEIFQGHVELQTRCCECEKVTSRREEYQDISVAVKRDTPDETESVGSQGCNKCDHGETEQDGSEITEQPEEIEAIKPEPLIKSEPTIKSESPKKSPIKSEQQNEVQQEPGETSEKTGEEMNEIKSELDVKAFTSLEEEVSVSQSITPALDVSVGDKPSDEFAWVRESLSEVERLQDDNKYYCDSCMHLTEAERSMHYTSVPQILTLHLKRFAIAQGTFGGFTKLTDHVPLPLTLPCIEDNCTQSEQHKLELYAVITHTGFTLSCGHYTAYIRAPGHSIALQDPEIIKQANEAQDDQSSTNQNTAPPPTESTGDSEAADPNNNADDNNNCDAVAVDTNTSETQYWFECDDDVITVMREDELLARLGPKSSSTTTPYLLFYQRV